MHDLTNIDGGVWFEPIVEARGPLALHAVDSRDAAHGGSADVAAAMRTAAQLGLQKPLCVRVSSRVEDLAGSIADASAASGWPLSRCIIELADALMGDRKELPRALSELRGRGAKIALADFGSTDSNYSLALAVRPDYLRIERYFLRDLHRDRYRRAVLESLTHLGRRIGAHIVAEGVSCPEELDALVALGADLVQGPAVGALSSRRESGVVLDHAA